MSVARPIRSFCSMPVSWADSDADGRLSSILSGRPSRPGCIVGGNLDGGTGDASAGEIGTPGDMSAGFDGCDTCC